jgi:alpha-D-ribose 1-methylphosphonate 5-triphosphate synthase subunit PhnH
MTICGGAYPTQEVIRVLITAMSHPGRVYSIPVKDNPEARNASLLAVVRTLFDHEVSFSIIDGNGTKTLAREIQGATDAREAEIPDADYVVVAGAASEGRILSAKRGTNAYPDRGATLLYVLGKSKSDLYLETVMLKGPGIEGTAKPQLKGLNMHELNYIRELNSEYPLGVDCIFLRGPDQVMCLPRSTRIIWE